jgi:hypothetical protein
MGRFATLSGLVALSLSVTGCDSDPPPAPACRVPVEVDPAGAHHTFVIDRFHLGESASEQTAYSLDLDCDGAVENSLGAALTTVLAFAQVDFDAELRGMLDAGQLLHLIDLQATDLGSAEGAGLTLLHAADLDGDPSDNFGGTEAFGVDERLGRGTIGGRIDGGQLSVGSDTLPLEIGLPGVDERFLAHLVGARVEATIGDGELDGTIAGCILDGEIDTVLVPVIVRGLGRGIARDCPDGTCIPGSFGDSVLEVYDVDGDGAISEQELVENSLTQILLQPDVDLIDATHDGVLAPNVDDIDDCISFAVQFHAVPATITE